MASNKKNKNTETEYNSDITKEDIDALGKKGLSMNKGDDRLLQNRKEKVDFSGENLDVPGENLERSTGTKPLKDEENTLYGQGGENKEHLEAPERANQPKRNS